MKRLTIIGMLLATVALATSCTTNERFLVKGVPGWVADGAQLYDEPAPYRPDPAIQHHEEEDGPVHFQVITDKRKYPNPPVKKITKQTLPKKDPFERGRYQRIKRVVR